jgi:hypothetical protein
MYRVLDAMLGVPARDWSAEYLVLAKSAEVRSDSSAAATLRSRIAGTTPSLALDGYAGTYRSEVYGDLRLNVEDGRLVLVYSPDYTAELEHWHHDTFRAVWRRTGFGRSFITFALDRRGRPATLDLDGFGEFRRVTTPSS